ncbi:MAG: efflux RND transporter periplasmic adaptor subunit [Pseudomonadota bacterium]
MSNTAWHQRAKFLLKDPTRAVFIAIVVLITLWFASGLIRSAQTPPLQAKESEPSSVAASWIQAQPITRDIVLYGDVEPHQIAPVKARVDGIIEEIVDVGTRVAAGDVLAKLSSDDRQARLAGARARLRSAELDYQATKKLTESGVATPSERERLLAQLEAARASVRSMELEIANTRLRAPIEGDVNRIQADLGAYVSVGSPVLEIVDNDPLVAVVHLHQAAVGRVRTGMQAQVDFPGDRKREGTVRFVSPVADARTRTFRTEISIANPSLELPSGLSVEVTIPTDTVNAHRLSTSMARLNARGQLGIHIVNQDQRIEFVPVEVVQARGDAVWVTGLPERARVVTISRGALSPGQPVTVRATPEEYLDSLGLDPATPEPVAPGTSSRPEER